MKSKEALRRGALLTVIGMLGLLALYACVPPDERDYGVTPDYYATSGVVLESALTHAFAPYYSPDIGPFATITPTRTPIVTPSSTLTPRLEPSPTPTATSEPTITSTAIPEKYFLNLDRARQLCRDAGVPINEWGMTRLDLVQIGEEVTYRCSEIPNMQDDQLPISITIEKPEGKDNELSFATTYVPFYFPPGSRYEVQILSCDDSCSVELLTAGGELIGVAEAELGEASDRLNVKVDGSTHGFIRVDVNDTLGGEGKVELVISKLP